MLRPLDHDGTNPMPASRNANGCEAVPSCGVATSMQQRGCARRRCGAQEHPIPLAPREGRPSVKRRHQWQSQMVLPSVFLRGGKERRDRLARASCFDAWAAITLAVVDSSCLRPATASKIRSPYRLWRLNESPAKPLLFSGTDLPGFTVRLSLTRSVPLTCAGSLRVRPGDDSGGHKRFNE